MSGPTIPHYQEYGPRPLIRMEREAVSDLIVLSKKEPQPKGYSVVRVRECTELKHPFIKLVLVRHDCPFNDWPQITSCAVFGTDLITVLNPTNDPRKPCLSYSVQY